MKHRLHSFLQEKKLVPSLSSPKREIEYWRLDVYNKLYGKLGDYETAETRKRHKMQEFNEVFALGESLYGEIYKEEYREKFKSFLGIIQSFLNDKSFDLRKGEGLNHLIAALINDIAKLYEDKGKEDFEHAMKTTFGEEMFERSKENHSFNNDEDIKYRSKAEISEIPSDSTMFLKGIISGSVWKILGQKIGGKKKSSKNISPLRFNSLFEKNNGENTGEKNEESETKRSSVRSIEFLLRIAYDTFFKEKHQKREMKEWQITQELNKIKHAYALSKWKFQEIMRNDGERFFNHLRNSAYNTIRYNQNASFDTFLVSMLHDIIEDTDIDFRTLRFYFGEKIALAVYSISKDSPLNHIKEDDTENQEKKEALEKSGLLNEDKKIKTKYQKIYDRYKDIFEYEDTQEENENKEKETTRFSRKDLEKMSYNPYKMLSQEEREKIEAELPGNMTLEKFVEYIKLYKDISKKYKKERNNNYMSHFLELDSFKENVEENIKKLKTQGIEINLEDNEIQKVADLALEAKFADRINNQETAEVRINNSEENKKKAQSKIIETKTYFYEICKNFDKKNGTNYCTGLKRAVGKSESFISD